MANTISKTELAEVKRALDDAEAGRATLAQLARAHDIVVRAEAGQTLGVIRSHIRDYTPPAPGHTAKRTVGSIIIGVVSGAIVWLLLGRRGPVTFGKARTTARGPS